MLQVSDQQLAPVDPDPPRCLREQLGMSPDVAFEPEVTHGLLHRAIWHIRFFAVSSWRWWGSPGRQLRQHLSGLSCCATWFWLPLKRLAVLDHLLNLEDEQLWCCIQPRPLWPWENCRCGEDLPLVVSWLPRWQWRRQQFFLVKQISCKPLQACIWHKKAPNLKGEKSYRGGKFTLFDLLTRIVRKRKVHIFVVTSLDKSDTSTPKTLWHSESVWWEVSFRPPLVWVQG